MSVFARTRRMIKDPHVMPMADQAIQSGMNFTVGILLAAQLGPAGFGSMTILILIMLVCLEMTRGLFVMPMQVILGKPHDAGYLNTILPLSTLCVLIAGFAAFTAAELGGAFMPEWGTAGYGVYRGISVCLILLQEIFRKYLYACNLMRPCLIQSILSCAVVLGGIGALTYSHQLSITAFLVLRATGAGVAALFMLPYLKLPFTCSRQQMRYALMRHWQQGKWLAASGGLRFISSDYLVLTAASVLGAASVGMLRAAQQLTNLLNVLLLGLESIVPVKAARALSHSGRHAMVRYLLFVTAASVALAVIYGGALTFAAPWVVPLIYGQQYGNLQGLIAAYSGVMILFITANGLRYALRAVEKTRSLFTGYAITAGLMVLCAHALLDGFGTYGVPVGIAGMLIILQVWYARAFQRSDAKADEQ